MGNRIEIDIVIIPEGKGKNKVYSIRSIQFPNVVTQGDTIEQAKDRLKEALELYFEDQKPDKFVKIENPSIVKRQFQNA